MVTSAARHVTDRDRWLSLKMLEQRLGREEGMGMGAASKKIKKQKTLFHTKLLFTTLSQNWTPTSPAYVLRGRGETDKHDYTTVKREKKKNAQKDYSFKAQYFSHPGRKRH